jgi:hypothetical protein
MESLEKISANKQKNRAVTWLGRKRRRRLLHAIIYFLVIRTRTHNKISMDNTHTRGYIRGYFYPPIMSTKYQKISMDICTLGYFKISVDITHHYEYGSRWPKMMDKWWVMRWRFSHHSSFFTFSMMSDEMNVRGQKWGMMKWWVNNGWVMSMRWRLVMRWWWMNHSIEKQKKNLDQSS